MQQEQGGKVVWVFDGDDKPLAAAYRRSRKDADGFSKDVERSNERAGASFDKLSARVAKSSQARLNGLKDALSSQPLKLGQALADVGKGGTGIGSQIQDLANRLNIARVRQTELAASSRTTQSAWLANQAAIQSYKSRLTEAIDAQQQATGGLNGLGGSMVTAVASSYLLVQGLQSLRTILSDSVTAANTYQAALLGLTSVARAFGQDSVAANDAARQLASDGLLTVADAAAGLKNLLASGFNLDQAITLMERFKDTAAFGRQAALGFGQSIRGATEGIKNGNSILTDNAGITKNLSVILQEMGKSQTDVMNITTDASVRLALFNGLLRESAPMMGDAAKLSDTYAGAQARAASQTQIFQQGLGAVVQVLTGGLINGYTEFLAANQTSIISLGAAAVGAGALTAALFLAVKAIQAFRVASIIAAATNPLLLALTAIAIVAGVVLFDAMNRLQAKLAESAGALTEAGDTAGTVVPSGFSKAGKAAEDLARKLADIDEQIAKQQRDFREQLAETIRGHQQRALAVEKSLAKENAAFAKSSAEKKRSLDDETSEAIKAHEERLIEIQRQIDEELTSSRDANSLKVRDLQASLIKERRSFEKGNAERQAKYQEDIGNAQAAHDEKVAELTEELNTEKALLNKHASDVAAVRDVILLDEVEKLKRSNDEQLKSLNKQKADAIRNAGETSSGVAAAFGGLPDAMKSAMGIGDPNGPMSNLGRDMGKAIVDSLLEAIKDLGKKAVESIQNGFYGTDEEGQKTKEFFKEFYQSRGRNLSGRAKGGPVSAGTPYMVGEMGREVFVPTVPGVIVPNDITERLIGGRSANQNVTFNVYNQMDFDRALRQMAWQAGN